MQQFTVALSAQEHAMLDKVHPPTEKSANVGRRAIEILKLHFQRADPTATFREQVDGADLEVTHCDGLALRIEVKGTASTGLAWEKLKVSGQPSYAALVAGMPLYRVTEVFEREVVVFVLRYGADFTMTPEPRWAVRKSAA